MVDPFHRERFCTFQDIDLSGRGLSACLRILTKDSFFFDLDDNTSFRIILQLECAAYDDDSKNPLHVIFLNRNVQHMVMTTKNPLYVISAH